MWSEINGDIGTGMMQRRRVWCSRAKAKSMMQFECHEHMSPVDE